MCKYTTWSHSNFPVLWLGIILSIFCSQFSNHQSSQAVSTPGLHWSGHPTGPQCMGTVITPLLGLVTCSSLTSYSIISGLAFQVLAVLIPLTFPTHWNDSILRLVILSLFFMSWSPFLPILSHSNFPLLKICPLFFSLPPFLFSIYSQYQDTDMFKPMGLCPYGKTKDFACYYKKQVLPYISNFLHSLIPFIHSRIPHLLTAYWLC